MNLDHALDKSHVIPVETSDDAPLPDGNDVYESLHEIQNNGFEITIRELLHAIGSKTAALPSSSKDDCLRASLLYTYILDLDSPHLSFRANYDSDLQTPRSQEIGIGMTCLLASRCFNVPWDQLGSLPGPGLRFDYRGKINGFDGIFESKGTAHRGNQRAQIRHGIEKKEAHHGRGDRFDVELIISTFIGRNGQPPRIVVADPDFDDLAKIYDRADNRFFRLRHYTRVLQFIGMPRTAFALYKYSQERFKGVSGGGIDLSRAVMEERLTDGMLTTESFDNQQYYGRWFDNVVEQGSKRYKKSMYDDSYLRELSGLGRHRVFQGVREDVYRAGIEGEPFTHDLLSPDEIRVSLGRIGRPASLFSDGTIQIFEHSSA
ncbi:hypothetical protein HOP61_07175 [Halomonas daqingensis]|uniref:HNH nuclease domain-containing protein n=1 Tax=Billgrantia desiderata TaxID=52021 RepID=A0AAW4YQA0_9GAMM|nr:hypothetical protein [Halomonas desiderata]MCE8051069.1 hypothetical protein [Halomonas desiderata]